MPSGQEHVEAALALCQSARARLAGAAGLDDAGRAELVQRVAKVESVLDGLKERFFLRSRLCLPFAERCEREAMRLSEALAAPGAGSAEAKPALEALEKAARALDSRSAMQGMAIT